MPRQQSVERVFGEAGAEQRLVRRDTKSVRLPSGHVQQLRRHSVGRQKPDLQRQTWTPRPLHRSPAPGRLAGGGSGSARFGVSVTRFDRHATLYRVGLLQFRRAASMICSLVARISAALCWSLAVLGPLAAADATATHPGQQGSGAVFVPNLWDPGSIPERPNTADIAAIRFVTVDDYPPFGFTLPDGALVGFNVDLARALCDELKVSCTIQARRFDTIVPALRAGTADAAIASMAITEAALANVDFTAPYYRTPARFFARVGTPSASVEPETIGQRMIGVARNTAHEAYLKAAFPDAQVRGFEGAAALRTALKSGAIDLAFGDGIGWVPWLASAEAQGCCLAVDGAYTDSRYFGEGAGIAVRKGNDKLRQALDYALARVAAEGRYGELYLKYFPIGIY